MAHDLSAKPLTPWRIMRWTGDDTMAGDADVIVVGGGLAGLVAATEIADAGKRVIVVDQEG